MTFREIDITAIATTYVDSKYTSNFCLILTSTLYCVHFSFKMDADEFDFRETSTSFLILNTTIAEPVRRRRSQLFVAKVAVQSFILGLAIFGNTCLFFALQRRRRNFTRMHVFITHLCFADMLVAFFNILPQLIWDFVGEWKAGDVMCKFVKFMQVFVMYLSTYVLVLTALDRRRAICSPLLSHTWTYRLVHLSVAGVYLLSAVLSLPQAIIFKYQDNRLGSGRKDCWVHFEPEWTLQAYITSFTMLVYIVPLVILIYAYGSISYTIFVRHQQSKTCNDKHRNSQLSDFSSSVNKRNSRSYSGSPMVPRSSSFAGFTRAKMKTVKLTFVIIIAYIACWSPFFISQLWWLYDEDAPANRKLLYHMT